MYKLAYGIVCSGTANESPIYDAQEIHFRKGNILELDFENDTIAGVVAFYAIVHFTKGQVEIACHEVFRVLQPGEIFLLTYHIGEETIHVEEFLGKEVDIDFMFFTSEFIHSCIKKSGS